MALRLISQLAHVEIISPKPEASAAFFRDIVGLEESGRDGTSVYLRGWGEFFRHSLQITEGPQPALGHIGWRAYGPDELDAAVKRIEASGRGLGWHNAGFGHGPAYRYRGPGGHLQELFWEVERWEAPEHLRSTFPNRPQRYVPRGFAARSLDHVTVSTRDVLADVDFFRDTLGHRFMEYTLGKHDPNKVIFAMTTTCERGHDMGFVADWSQVAGRLNHVAFWLDQREDLRRAADVLLDADVPIEFGPGRHGLGEQDYLYFREPGGIRIELNSGGYHNYEPDWQPVKWTLEQGSNVYYRNAELPTSMYESFPPAETHRPVKEKENVFI